MGLWMTYFLKKLKRNLSKAETVANITEILRSGSDRPAEGEAILAKVAIIGCYFSISQLPSSAKTVRNARGELFTIF